MTLVMTALSETEFRAKIQSTFDQIEKPFERVDPDVAECEQSLGSMTITLSDRSRCILSAQPSVRQLWLALAARGTAVHFNFQGSHTSGHTNGQWIDDKGKGIELLSFLQAYLKDTTGVSISF